MASVLLRRRVVRVRHVSGMVIRLALVGASLVWAMFLSSVAWAQTCEGFAHRVYTSSANGGFSYGPFAVPDNTAETRLQSCRAGVAVIGPQIALHLIGLENATYTFSNHRATVPDDVCNFNIQVTQTRKSNGTVSESTPVGRSAFVEFLTGQCPDECDANPGLGVGSSFTTTLAPSANGSGDYCNSVSKCKMEVSTSMSVGGSTIYKVTHTDKNCSGSEPPVDNDDFDDDETCTTTASGNQFCMSQDGENCGWLNGEFLCVPSVENDGCGVFSDGGRLCGSDAPTPPVPDNGNPGQPAEPDDVFESTDSQGNSNTYNYYNNNTVNNSNRPPGSSGDNPYDGEDDGRGTGGGSGDDGGGGNGEGLMCDPATDTGCNGDGESGEAGDLREGWQCWADGSGFAAAVGQCFSDATQALWNGLVNDASVLSIANQTAAAWPAGGGSCPSDVVNIGWLNASFDFWEVPCTFLDDIEAVLGPLFLLMWSLMGLRILLTIPGGGE